jgi:hypothetical protein
VTADLIPCKRCELPHPRCKGHKQDGKPCMQWPRRGATVCKRHGGNAPQVKAAAERRQQEEDAQKALATYGQPRAVDPAQALLEEVHRTAGHVAWLSVVVAGLDQESLVWGVAEEIDRPAGATAEGGWSPGGTETKRKAAPNVWLDLYARERKHLADVCKAAIAAGVSVRIVNVFEQVGAAYVAVLDRVLERLELTPGQRLRVPGVVEAELRTLASGEEADRG